MHVHDHGRIERLGMPEAVLCSSKTIRQLDLIIGELADTTDAPVLFTRLSAERFTELDDASQAALAHDSVSETATLHGSRSSSSTRRVAVVAAGTSDEKVAAEAVATLRFSGIETELIVDVGVAGVWRLEQRLPDINAADIVIAVAGMDAALISVLGGLVRAPIVGVPTSVGYGVAEGGTAALHSALASCAQGVTVVNIDNGFGAACAALRMIDAFDGPT